MSIKKQLLDARKSLEAIRDYPSKGKSRRTKDGYPEELIYDEFAYKRIVNSYREVAKAFFLKYPKEPILSRTTNK